MCCIDAQLKKVGELRRALPLVAYFVRTGPFHMSWVRRGLDPRVAFRQWFVVLQNLECRLTRDDSRKFATLRQLAFATAKGVLLFSR